MLLKMNDPYTKLQSGDKGTVTSVDDMGTIHVSWDSGSSLGVVFGEGFMQENQENKNTHLSPIWQ